MKKFASFFIALFVFLTCLSGSFAEQEIEYPVMLDSDERLTQVNSRELPYTFDLYGTPVTHESVDVYNNNLASSKDTAYCVVFSFSMSSADVSAMINFSDKLKYYVFTYYPDDDMEPFIMIPIKNYISVAEKKAYLVFTCGDYYTFGLNYLLDLDYEMDIPYSITQTASGTEVKYKTFTSYFQFVLYKAYTKELSEMPSALYEEIKTELAK
ncbi:MAG: hypothetical protein ACI4WX_13835 [Aristaeellaceae bacterium]